MKNSVIELNELINRINKAEEALLVKQNKHLKKCLKEYIKLKRQIAKLDN